MECKGTKLFCVWEKLFQLLLLFFCFGFLFVVVKRQQKNYLKFYSIKSRKVFFPDFNLKLNFEIQKFYFHSKMEIKKKVRRSKFKFFDIWNEYFVILLSCSWWILCLLSISRKHPSSNHNKYGLCCVIILRYALTWIKNKNTYQLTALMQYFRIITWKFCNR